MTSNSMVEIGPRTFELSIKLLSMTDMIFKASRCGHTIPIQAYERDALGARSLSMMILATECDRYEYCDTLMLLHRAKKASGSCSELVSY